MKRAMWMMLMLVACGGEDSSAGADVQQEDVVDRFWEEPPSDRATFADGRFLLSRSAAAVISLLNLQGTVDGAQAMGFDLDGQVTEAGDPASCGHGDLNGLAGEPGVDNQFALVWDIIQPLVGVQVNALLLEAINEGRFLLMIELSDVDDLVNDANVTLRLLRGRLDPQVSASGHLLPSQTYGVDPDFPVSEVTGAAIVDGVLEAGPVQVRVPIEIFDANFVLPIEGGRVRVRIDPETGAMDGVLGGTVHVGEMMAELLSTGAAAEAELVRPFMENNADMDKMGDTCQRLSAAFGFSATAGFVLHRSE